MNNSFNSLFKALLCGGMMLAANVQCEKMNLSADDADANVTIRIASYEQMPFPARTRASAEEVCTRLCFHVYDDDGVKVDYANQKIDGETFGTAFFTLEKGHYFIVVVGHSAANNPSFYANERVTISGSDLGDTFWCVKEINVDSDRIEETLTLKRIVSKICFIPTDAIPSDLYQIIFEYKGSKGTFDGLTGYGSTNVKQKVILDVSPDDHQYSFFMIPRSESDAFDIDIKTYGWNNKNGVIPLFSKMVANVPVERNRITICRGNLFDNVSSDSSFKIDVIIDDTWGSNIEYDF